MKKSYKTGISFGLVSGVLTTLGLLIGLGVGTQSKVAVVGGILTIAIADALSDAFGIHLSQESVGTNSDKYIWESTMATFLSKFLFAITFLIPVIFFNLDIAVKVSVIWGFILIGYLSFLVSRSSGKEDIYKVVLEHISLFTMVIILSYAIGLVVNLFLN